MNKSTLDECCGKYISALEAGEAAVSFYGYSPAPKNKKSYFLIGDPYFQDGVYMGHLVKKYGGRAWYLFNKNIFEKYQFAILDKDEYNSLQGSKRTKKNIVTATEISPDGESRNIRITCNSPERAAVEAIDLMLRTEPKYTNIKINGKDFGRQEK